MNPSDRGGWWEDRIGLRSFVRRFLRGTVAPKGAMLRTTGVAALVLVLVECITGAALSVYYTPAPGRAYQAIQVIEQMPGGHFVRGLHHWASATLLVLCAATLMRMFFGAEYKGRRDVVWLAVVVFSHLALFAQLTGHILPWDTNAAASANVEAGIGGNVWLVGPAIKQLILGEPSAGARTLERWYGMHVTLLPLAMLIFIGLPLLAYRLRQGEVEEAAGPEGVDLPQAATRVDPYYPVHLAREMAVALAVFAIVAVVAWFGKTPLELEATAQNLQAYHAMSEWYVLPMHALTLIPPFNRVEWEPVVTFVVPGLFVLALIALPFVDRNPATRLSRRPVAAAAGGLCVLGIVAVTAWAVTIERPLVAGVGGEIEAASSGHGNAADAALAEQGKKVYAAQACDSCHVVGGKGGQGGPDLTHAGTLHPDAEWQEAHLVAPASKVPGSTMPAYATLKPEERRALVAYMLSLK